MKKIILFLFVLLFVMIGHSQVTYSWVEVNDSLKVNGDAFVDTLKYNDGGKWIAYGDSYTSRDTCYANYVRGIINFTTFVNEGVSGNRIDEITDRLEADIVGDPNYLDGTNFVTLQFGQNDWNQNSVLGTINDTADHPSVVGYLKQFIVTAYTATPSIKLYVIPPPLAKTDTATTTGWRIKDLSYMVNRVCRLYGVPVIDWYSMSGINVLNSAYYLDSDHPNRNGARVLGNLVVDAFIGYQTAGNSAVNDTTVWEVNATGRAISAKGDVDSLFLGNTMFRDGQSSVLYTNGTTDFYTFNYLEFKNTTALVMKSSTSNVTLESDDDGNEGILFKRGLNYVGRFTGTGLRVGDGVLPSYTLDVNGDVYASTSTIHGSQDTTVTAIVGKIVFQASDSTFYGCRSIVASQKWYPLN